MALIVDDDGWTREHRSWRWLEERPWGVSSDLCQRTGNAQPLATDLPETCETIQRLGGGGDLAGGAVQCEPLSQVASRQSRGSDLRLTPARQALQRACDRLVQAGSEPAGWAVAVMAFDGIPDEPGRGSPAGEFAETLAKSCVARGVGVHVVAKPEAYRYLYILSSERHHEFAGDVASRLAILLDDAGAAPGGGSVHPAQVLRLTPYRLLRQGERRSVARLRLTRALLEGYEGDPRKSFESGAGYGAELGISALNVSLWLASKEYNRAGWQLGWTADPASWQELASHGTLLAPPEVHGNKPAPPQDPSPGGPAAGGSTASAWRLGADLGYHELQPGECAAPLERRHAGWQGEELDCPQVAAALYQTATLERGRLNLELFRGQPGGVEWLLAGSTGHAGGAAVPALEDVHDPRFVRAITKTENEPLASFALISPALRIDPCAAELHAALLNSSALVSAVEGGRETLPGRLAAKSVSAACAQSPLHDLLVSFTATRPSKFQLTEKDRPGAPFDLRVGMETLASSIFASASALTTRNGAARFAAAEPCLLGGLRVVYECPAPGASRR